MEETAKCDPLVESRVSDYPSDTYPENSIEARIKKLPPDIRRPELARVLTPIIAELAKLDIPEGDALLNHAIKEHFGLRETDLKSYRSDLRVRRKELKAEVPKQSPSQNQLIARLKDEQRCHYINPAQDFQDGVMYFAVTIEGKLYLLNSRKELIAFEELNTGSIRLKHKEVSTTRFSPQGIARFMRGDCAVDVATLYDRIHRYIERFIVFTDRRWIDYLTLWIIGTYVFSIFGYYPYVWLNAEKGSGKSLLMKVLSAIAFNGEIVTNPTAAVVFRDVSYNSISMFIDEVEQLRKQDKEMHSALISLLNSGFEKAGVVKRTEKSAKGSFELKEYSVYSPKMLAGINEIDDVLQDRAVRVKLLRKKDSEEAERYKVNDQLLELQREIRDDLYIFALTWASDLAKLYSESDTSIRGMSHLTNRELDIWEPIFLLANMVDEGNGSDTVTSAMQSLSQDSLLQKQEENRAVNSTCELLTTLKSMLTELDPLDVEDETLVFDADKVLEYFQKTDEFHWLPRRNALTTRLKKVDVRTDRRRYAGTRKMVYLLKRATLEDLYERYVVKGMSEG